MSDRHFTNDLLPSQQQPPSYSAQDLIAAGISLKNEVVQATWSRRWSKVHDPTLYTGVLGTAFLCFRSYQMTANKDDLALCLEIVKSCSIEASISMKKYFTFICGRSGIYALGAAAAKYAGNNENMHYFLKLLREMVQENAFVDDSRMPNELLYGRAGFLWACLFVNKQIGEEQPIIHSMIAMGRLGALHHIDCPLMYEWYGTRYWGAAHGLAGIMYLLMHFPLNQEDANDVKRTLLYMIKHRFRSGNYPSSEEDTRDSLVHWCHGAPGLILTLCKAAEVFPSDVRFKEAAIDAGEVVWTRGLLRRVGICHGISGNTYAFLALYRITGDIGFLDKANAFTKFLLERGRKLISTGEMHGGDHPYSLFEGFAGTACLFLDMARPEMATFPGYEI